MKKLIGYVFRTMKIILNELLIGLIKTQLNRPALAGIMKACSQSQPGVSAFMISLQTV